MKTTMLLVPLALILCAAADAAAPAKKWYWSVAQANEATKQQGSTPYCVISKNDSANCANGKLLPGSKAMPYRFTWGAKCQGVPAASKGGRYSEFVCTVKGVNDLFLGHVAVYTAGPTTIRWKMICAQC